MLASIQNLYKNYGADDILSNINLTIEEHSRIGLIGPNGSGKSTLMKIIAGLLPPDGGGVTFRTGATVGYLRQDLGLTDSCTILDCLLYTSRRPCRRQDRPL